MNSVKEGAAPGIHHNDGPPRLNSRRCGNDYTPAKSLNQSLIGAPPAATRKQQEGRMNQEIATNRDNQWAIIDQVVVKGDLSKLTGEQRVMYYNKVCESCGLNPMTNPFSYLEMKGKTILYANKDCTEQLRKINGVSIEGLDGRIIDDVYFVTAKARDKTGRVDQSTGAVSIGNLRGEAKANSMMKAETKAKRRVTLSISGLGFIDDSEVDSIPGAKVVDIDLTTGEIKGQIEAQASAVVVEKEESADIKARIDSKQLIELENILNECEPQYKKWVYDRVKAAFGTDDLSGLTADMYERTKAAAIKNMQKNYEKLSSDSQVDVAVEVAQ